MPGAQRITLGIPLSINRENADALAAVPGLSLRLAQRVVLDRKQRGAYKNLQQLTRVRGIGPRTVERIRSYLTVQP